MTSWTCSTGTWRRRTPTIYRLREGIERFLITDITNPAAASKAQSELSVMADTVTTMQDTGASFNHLPGGSNVLYMDGHVAFCQIPRCLARQPPCGGPHRPVVIRP